jgi:hypothetical protein
MSSLIRLVLSIVTRVIGIDGARLRGLRLGWAFWQPTSNYPTRRSPLHLCHLLGCHRRQSAVRWLLGDERLVRPTGDRTMSVWIWAHVFLSMTVGHE